MTKSEMVLSKTFSAQWLMSVVTTFFACLVTFYVVAKRPEYVNLVVPAFLLNWGIIMNNYFKRDRSQDASLTKEPLAGPK